MSTYQSWEHPNYVDDDGDTIIVKIRFSDHPLPLSYSQPDFDVRSTMADTGSHVASGGWYDALRYLCELTSTQIPLAATNAINGVAKSKHTKEINSQKRLLTHMEKRLHEWEKAVNNGEAKASKSSSGKTWKLDALGHTVFINPPTNILYSEKAVIDAALNDMRNSIDDQKTKITDMISNTQVG